ncbi:hypothetical protein BU202_04725 [Streptococcus cuniculi]|uniref:Uncharacterized protein n=1 Tax=Streptococcus cuniculi TaxID=1432788 RepID=A0A1Q8E927_9STRE|nr:hypothetical protein [Streptococcus cuniculi]OLF48301.1 hypothetical protein BU202_04725 [Streptococcus cuniculi]
MKSTKQKKQWLRFAYNGWLFLAIIYMIFYILVDTKVISATQPVSLIVLAIAVGLSSSVKKVIEKKLDEQKDDSVQK